MKKIILLTFFMVSFMGFSQTKPQKEDTTTICFPVNVGKQILLDLNELDKLKKQSILDQKEIKELETKVIKEEDVVKFLEQKKCTSCQNYTSLDILMIFYVSWTHRLVPRRAIR